MSNIIEYEWRKCDLADALDVAIRAGGVDRSSKGGYCRPSKAGSGGDFVTLIDGTLIYSESQWTGPYSEVTPDIDGEPPVFWIGTIKSDTVPVVKEPPVPATKLTARAKMLLGVLSNN
jgi:hypothetical protein